MKSLLLNAAILAIMSLVGFSGTVTAEVLPGVHDDYPIPGEGCPDIGDSDFPPFLRAPRGPVDAASRRFVVLP